MAEKAWIHVMGGLHALEHAAIGVFPLLVLADRNDLGGISTPFHPQLESAGIFIYDGLPGGTGLCTQAFVNGNGLLDATLSAISECPCETGCPSCVHSPKCGSGNRPIDKAGAIFLLKTLIYSQASSAPLVIPEPIDVEEEKAADEAPIVVAPTDKAIRYGVLDIETQLSAKAVGGWHHAARMRVSCVVLYNTMLLMELLH